MNAFRLTDPIKVYFQFAFVIAAVLSAPVLLYQIWAFVSPGLYEKERKVTLSYIPASIVLFLAGVSFAYFVLFPFVVRFMSQLADQLGVQQMIGINEYFQFLASARAAVWHRVSAADRRVVFHPLRAYYAAASCSHPQVCVFGAAYFSGGHYAAGCAVASDRHDSAHQFCMKEAVWVARIGYRKAQRAAEEEGNE